MTMKNSGWSLWLCVCLAWTYSSHASYSLLKLPAGARLAALGSFNFTIPDLYSVLSNPSLMGISPDPAIGFYYAPYFQDLTVSSIITRLNYKQIGLACGIMNSSITDIAFYPDHPTEQPQAFFDSHQMLVFIGTGFPISRQAYLGFTSKFIYQKIYRYDSRAVAFDLGLSFRPERLPGLTLGLTYQNFGFSSSMKNENLDFPVSFGFGVGYDWVITPQIQLVTSLCYQSQDHSDQLAWGNEIRYHKWLRLLVSLHSRNDIYDAYSFGTQLNIKSYSVILSYLPTAKPFDQVSGISFIKHF